MRMLVAYGSERGGTEGLARALADTLRALGVPTYVSDATDVASKMARTRAGDWRDPMQIHDWARQIASSLTAAAPTAHAPAP